MKITSPVQDFIKNFVKLTEIIALRTRDIDDCPTSYDDFCTLIH